MRLWHSATTMTWLAQVVRLAGIAILLPLVLARFSDAEVSVWFLFSALASLQAIVDLGFGPTFAREISYGFAGASVADRHDGPELPSNTRSSERWAGPDRAAIASVTATMFWLYRRIAAAFLLLLAGFGSWAAWVPIERLPDPGAAWVAWSGVVLASALAIHGNAYASFLIGADRIALQKRGETIVTAVSLLGQIVAVAAGLGLLALVLVAQAGLAAQVLVNRRLMRRSAAGHGLQVRPGEVDRRIVVALWPAAWRTAIGALLSIGISQGMVIAAANLFVAAEAASVQLALRVMQVISQFSQAPYYTQLPRFNRLHAGRQPSMLAAAAARAMRVSLWIFVAAAMAIDLVLRPLLPAIGSQTLLPGSQFWVTLALAVFAERFGAMHVQLLLARNVAVAHVANGGAAIIWLAALALLFTRLGTLAIPLSMLIAYGGFYAPCAALLSHARLGAVDNWDFERRTSLPPLLAILAYAVTGWPQGMSLLLACFGIAGTT